MTLTNKELLEFAKTQNPEAKLELDCSINWLAAQAATQLSGKAHRMQGWKNFDDFFEGLPYTEVTPEYAEWSDWFIGASWLIGFWTVMAGVWFRIYDGSTYKNIFFDFNVGQDILRQISYRVMFPKQISVTLKKPRNSLILNELRATAGRFPVTPWRSTSYSVLSNHKETSHFLRSSKPFRTFPAAILYWGITTSTLL